MMRILWLMGCVALVSCQSNLQNETYARSHQSKKVTSKTPTHSLERTEAWHRQKDGAPSGPPPSSFKPVKPIQEPLSRYGNPDVYRVDGKTYAVLTSPSGYRTRGLASWYGTKFHQMRTSSGERYDMYALTAAHKTLPIPCYVKVKNLDNGRTVIVKVNDRGPFHSERVMDLSYAAAVQLGLFPKGTARVEIEALTVKNGKGAHTAHYYLQAGAFQSNQLAERLRDKLSKLTPSPVFIERYQHRFIVRVGPFANRTMTNQLKQVLMKHGVSGSFSVLL